MSPELPPPAPGRSRVRAQRGNAASARNFPVAREIAEQSGVGRLLVDSLIRSQLRLGIVVGSGFLLLLCAVPLLLGLFTELNSMLLLGIPAPWIFLGIGIHPVIFVSAWLYSRAADRNEEAFQDLVADK